MGELVKFESDNRDGYEWLDEIADKMGMPGRRDHACRALKGVLHVFRDSMLIHEVFNLSARLPLYIRGLFFENYDPQNSTMVLYNKTLLEKLRYRMGPGNSSYFEDYLNEITPEKIDGDTLLRKLGERLESDHELHTETAYSAVMDVLIHKITDWKNIEANVLELQTASN